MTDTKKIRVTVIGASGQFGFPLTMNLIKEGADVVVISRKRYEGNEKNLAALENAGAKLGYISNPEAEQKELVDLLKGSETVVIAATVGKALLENVYPHYVTAAAKAGVSRFLPSEFGVHTAGLRAPHGPLFSAKRAFQQKIRDAGLAPTLFYNGLNFDYCLPNLRFWDSLQTFGDLDLKIGTHHIDDIGAIAAKVILDPRTKGKCVQMYHNVYTQNEMVALLKSKWPKVEFDIKHVSTESIKYDLENATDAISAKKGVETDLERAYINYACYVTGDLCNPDAPNTLKADDLYPDHVYKKVEDSLADPMFVFGKHVDP